MVSWLLGKVFVVGELLELSLARSSSLSLSIARATFGGAREH